MSSLKPAKPLNVITEEESETSVMMQSHQIFAKMNSISKNSDNLEGQISDLIKSQEHRESRPDSHHSINESFRGDRRSLKNEEVKGKQDRGSSAQLDLLYDHSVIMVDKTRQESQTSDGNVTVGDLGMMKKRL